MTTNSAQIARAAKALAAPSSRSEVSSFVVMDVMNRAQELEMAGREIIHLEVGQPGTPAPRRAREAAKAAIDNDLLGYTTALGLPELRERISQHYADWYGVTVPAERVAVTIGSSAGFILAFLASFDPGDRVLLPAPGYPCYRNILQVLGLQPVICELNDEHRWMPTPEMIHKAAAQEGGLAGVLLASPANPTGTMLTPDRFQALNEAATQVGARFMSDEIYHGLCFDEPAKTALAYNDQAIVINSFSKYFSMTGWRVGWLILPEHLVRPVERLAQNLFIAAPTVSQRAAIAAFDDGDELEGHKRVYETNRLLLAKGLREAGFTKLLPSDGAFYHYADVSDFGQPSDELARSLIEDAGVAVTPGHDFDPDRGPQFLRFSFARSTSHIEQGINRILDWSHKHR